MRGSLMALLIVVAVWALSIVTLFALGKPRVARELAGLLPNLLLLFKGLATDARVPRRAKILLVVGAAWIASPIDLIPEFIPVLGPLDDLIVAALILRAVVRWSDDAVVAAHWRGDRATLDRLIGLAGRS